MLDTDMVRAALHFCSCCWILTVVSPFLVLSWNSPAVAWAAPSFVLSQNMSHSDSVQTVAEAMTSQVKLCAYDKEEPAVWFHLIEAQFTAVGIKSQKLKYSNALASLPMQVPQDILDTVNCLQWIRSTFWSFERSFAWEVRKEQIAVLFWAAQ